MPYARRTSRRTTRRASPRRYTSYRARRRAAPVRRRSVRRVARRSGSTRSRPQTVRIVIQHQAADAALRPDTLPELLGQQVAEPKKARLGAK